MKVAVIGSRGLSVPAAVFARVLPPETSEIVSGGARGVDSSARNYARSAGIPLREFLPDYHRFGRRAPLIRNDQIVCESDVVFAFWDQRSRGTAYTIRQARAAGKPVRIFVPNSLLRQKGGEK